MIKRAYGLLPGPTTIRVTISLILLVAALVSLHFFYEWVGNTFLDNGGAVG